MQLENYRALISAIDTGSISAAAETLSYTPSGVSRMIAALEREFGFALLHRGKSGVTPTAECVTMLPLLRKLCFPDRRFRRRYTSICRSASARFDSVFPGPLPAPLQRKPVFLLGGCSGTREDYASG